MFNTLANVQALVESGSPRAPEVLKSLIAYLRAAMPRLHEAQATIGNEVTLVRSYLELMQMRMPDRLRFVIDINLALHGEYLPGMALLTLVENAVRHGIDPSEDGGQIVVGARRDASATLTFWVADSGIGLSNSAVLGHDGSTGTGTGLANLRSRLDASFAGRARLALTEVQPHGLRAEIIIAPIDA